MIGNARNLSSHIIIFPLHFHFFTNYCEAIMYNYIRQLADHIKKPYALSLSRRNININDMIQKIIHQ